MPDLEPGTQLERFEVLERLGSGGMATGYLVRHRRLESLHALKVLQLPRSESCLRLMREGRLQGGLRHTNIVAVTDVIDVQGAPALIMEYVDGPSLAALMQGRQLSLDQVDVLARGFLAGLTAAHEKGLVHRDLKPANILLQVQRDALVPKIADFGIARLLDESGASLADPTRTGALMGTPSYMAPEQLGDAKRVDARADVFSAGVVLYELVTGRRAFQGSNVYEVADRIRDGRCEPLDKLRSDLPPRMARAIAKAMAVDVTKRPADGGALQVIWEGVPGLQSLSPDGLWPEELLRPRAPPPAPPSPSEPTFEGGFAPPTAAGVVPTPDLAGPTKPGVPSFVDQSGSFRPAPLPLSAKRAPPPTAPAGKRPGLGILVLLVALLVSAGAAGLGLLALFSQLLWQADRPLDASPEIVSQDPAVQTQYERGWSALMAADYQRTELHFRSAATLEPDNAVLQLGVAHVVALRNDPEDPNQAIHYLPLSRALELAGDRDDRHGRYVRLAANWAPAAEWDRFHADHPDCFSAYLTRAYLGIGYDSVEDKLAAWERLMVAAPHAVVPYLGKADALVYTQRWDEAWQVLEQGLAKNPGAPALLKYLGWIAFQRDQPAVALSWYEQAFEADPGLYGLRLEMAWTHLLLGDEQRARVHEQALWSEVTPIRERLRLSRWDAEFRMGLGQLSAARGALERCERLAAEAQDCVEAFGCFRVRVNQALLAGGTPLLPFPLESLRRQLDKPSCDAGFRAAVRPSLALVEGLHAAEEGDVRWATEILARLESEENPPPASSMALLRQRAAEARGELADEIAKLQAQEPNCESLYHLARLQRMAGLEQAARQGLLALPEPGQVHCSLMNGRRTLLASARLNLAELAFRAGDAQEAAAQLQAFDTLWPLADADHPWVLRAGELQGTVGIGEGKPGAP